MQKIDQPSQINNLEARLNSAHLRINQLTDQNRALQAKNLALQNQKDYYASLVSQDPLLAVLNEELSVKNMDHVNPNIEANANVRSNLHLPSRQQGLSELNIFSQRVLIQQQTIAITENALDNLQKDLISANQAKFDLTQRLGDLMVNLQGQKQRGDNLSQQIETLKKRLKNYEAYQTNVEKTLLNQKRDIQQVSSNLQHERKQYSKNITSIARYLTHFSRVQEQDNDTENQSVQRVHLNQNIKSDQSLKELQQTFQSHRFIMEEMGLDIDRLTQELKSIWNQAISQRPQQRLKLQSKGNSLDSQANDQVVGKQEELAIGSKLNTKNFEKQCFSAILGDKRRLMQNLSTKFHQTKQLLIVTLEENKNLKVANNSLNSQNSQYSQLEKLNRQLQRDLEQANKEQVQLKQYISEIERNLKEILEENQCYHKFMSKQHGKGQYMYRIEKQRNLYLERQEERRLKEGWANVQELIAMNMKLRSKLREG